MFADLFPNDETERNALKIVCDNGVMQIILSFDGTFGEKEHILLRSVEILDKRAFMNKQIAKLIVESIMEAIYPDLMQTRAKSNDGQASASKTKAQDQPRSMPEVSASPAATEGDLPVDTKNYTIIDNITGQRIDQSQYTIAIDSSVMQRLTALKEAAAERTAAAHQLGSAIRQHAKSKEAAANKTAAMQRFVSVIRQYAGSKEAAIYKRSLDFFDFVLMEDGTYGVKAKEEKKNCDEAYDIVIPDSYMGAAVTTIENYAFDGCRGVKSIVIPPSIHTIKPGAFQGIKTNIIQLSPQNRHFRIEGDCLIENGAERLIHGDETSRIPCGVKIIGEWAFAQCYYLVSIRLPDGVLTIEDDAFYDCTRLNDINIPDSVRRICSGAFYECNRLENITLPDSIVEIGSMAFRIAPTSSLRALPRKLEYLGSLAFNYDNWEEIVIPSTVKKIEDSGFFHDNFVKLKISDSHPYYELKNNCLIEKQTGRLIGEGSGTEIVIPDGVTTIGKSAFCYHSELQSIVMPRSVKVIEEGAFTDTYISNIEYGGTRDEWELLTENVPALLNAKVNCLSLSDIKNEEIFEFKKREEQDPYLKLRCTYIVSLKKGIVCPPQITIPSKYKGKKVKGIGPGAFKNCVSVESIDIPDGIEYIDFEAFSGCINLSSISIPQSVREIGYAFEGCQNLTSIFYAGTKDEWEEIKKYTNSRTLKVGRAWKEGSGKFVVYCKDKKIPKFLA